MHLRPQLVSYLTRRFPFISGSARFANSRLVDLAAGNCTGEAWTRLDCGAELLVGLGDYVGRAAYYVGDLDRKISAIARRIVRPGDHVLDIGANIGVVTMQLARLVGDRGVVHSFEPNPAANGLLAQSIERNGFQYVRLHRFALGEQEGTLQLSFPSGNLGMATLNADTRTDGWNHVEVPVKLLAEVAEEFDFGHVRFIKIDVEGFELGVFRGAGRWFASDPPDAIVFETIMSSANGEESPVVSLLSDHGYRLFSLPKALFSVRLVPYRPGVDAAASHDMLAVREGCADEIRSLFSS